MIELNESYKVQCTSVPIGLEKYPAAVIDIAGQDGSAGIPLKAEDAPENI